MAFRSDIYETNIAEPPSEVMAFLRRDETSPNRTIEWMDIEKTLNFGDIKHLSASVDNCSIPREQTLIEFDTDFEPQFVVTYRGHNCFIGRKTHKHSEIAFRCYYLLIGSAINITDEWIDDKKDYMREHNITYGTDDEVFTDVDISQIIGISYHFIVFKEEKTIKFCSVNHPISDLRCREDSIYSIIDCCDHRWKALVWIYLGMGILFAIIAIAFLVIYFCAHRKPPVITPIYEDLIVIRSADQTPVNRMSTIRPQNLYV